jgi:hypothetical protein
MMRGRAAGAAAIFVPAVALGCAANTISFGPDNGSGGAVPLALDGGECEAGEPDAEAKPDATMADAGRHCPDTGAFDPDADIVVEVPEVSMSDLSVSASGCPRSVTLSATVVNDSPFGVTLPVAFYHSESKRLIGVVKAPLVGGENGPELTAVQLVWENPPAHPELVIVVADDDGAGCSTIGESNESDNVLSAVLAICPSP